MSPNYWHAHALLLLADARHRLGDVDGARELLDAARSELDVLPDEGMFALLLDETEDHLSGRRRREGFLGEELSESELRVLRLLAEGRSLREVAGELYLSQNTVKSHRRTIYRKLGAQHARGSARAGGRARPRRERRITRVNKRAEGSAAAEARLALPAQT